MEHGRPTPYIHCRLQRSTSTTRRTVIPVLPASQEGVEISMASEGLNNHVWIIFKLQAVDVYEHTYIQICMYIYIILDASYIHIHVCVEINK